MKRFALLVAISIVTIFIYKIKFRAYEVAPHLKLSGFSIVAPVAKTLAVNRRTANAQAVERAAKTSSSTGPASAVAAAVKDFYLPTSEVTVIAVNRAKIAWINIREKAYDRLGVDSQTKQNIEELRSKYAGDTKKFEARLKLIVGANKMDFLKKVRHEFQARVFERTHVEVGPQLGSL